MQKRFRVPIFALTAVVAFALLAAGAVAQVTVGQVAPTPNPEAFCEETLPFDEFQTAVSSGASYAVPAPGGVITSWSTNAGPGAGQKLELKVFRPIGPGAYTVVGHDIARALVPSTLNTFPVSIPVQAGDVVGTHVFGNVGLETSTPTACLFETGSVLDKFGWKQGNAATGASFGQENEGSELRLNISATVLPPPALTSLLTVRGSIKGGTPVIITGANLAEVRGVSFGTTPASFVVNSETQLTAVAPPSATLSKVPVTVTTAAGTATSLSTFAYEGCAVPKLTGKKLKASKRVLKKNDCGLGKLRKSGGVNAKTGKVVKQNPAPGKILAPGSKVGIKLG